MGWLAQDQYRRARHPVAMVAAKAGHDHSRTAGLRQQPGHVGGGCLPLRLEAIPGPRVGQLRYDTKPGLARPDDTGDRGSPLTRGALQQTACRASSEDKLAGSQHDAAQSSCCPGEQELR